MLTHSTRRKYTARLDFSILKNLTGPVFIFKDASVLQTMNGCQSQARHNIQMHKQAYRPPVKQLQSSPTGAVPRWGCIPAKLFCLSARGGGEQFTVQVAKPLHVRRVFVCKTVLMTFFLFLLVSIFRQVLITFAGKNTGNNLFCLSTFSGFHFIPPPPPTL